MTVIATPEQTCLYYSSGTGIVKKYCYTHMVCIFTSHPIVVSTT